MPARQKERSASIGLDAQRLYAALNTERKLRGLSLEQTAAELDVAYPTMRCWRRGANGMNADAALRISLFLRVDLRRFTRQIDPPPATRKAA